VGEKKKVGFVLKNSGATEKKKACHALLGNRRQKAPLITRNSTVQKGKNGREKSAGGKGGGKRGRQPQPAK